MRISIAFVLCLAACLAAGAGEFIITRGQQFIAPDGCQMLLHGMNVISKSPKTNYQSWHGPEQFADMRAWGMNCIRLGILWDGLEPTPGEYDEAYLVKVDQRIAWAREHGIYVMLDMHQDLFSVLYSDGAPEWATLHEGKPHIRGGSVWSDAYFTSPAVQAAFDNFWANTPGPDGVGIQDRFALAWQHVAARYADDPTVVGYDLFNEPNSGSMNADAQMKMVESFARLLAEKTGEPQKNPLELVGKWLTPAGRSEVMALLKDIELYKQVLADVAPMFQEFECEYVTPMFERVTRAIREVDANHIIFLETGMAANGGVYTGIEPVRGKDGKRDALQAYAPHGYDIVVDTPDIANASTERIELIFSFHGETAQRLNMPILVGEWGAYGGAGKEIVPAAWAVVHEFEKLLCGDTYWEFGRYVYDAAYFEVLCRPIPQRIAGTLLSYHYDPETKRFSCRWREDPDVTAPTRVYLPRHARPESERIAVAPEGGGYTFEPVGDDGHGCLVVPPTGEAVERDLTVSAGA